MARTFRRRTYSEELGETAVLSPTLLNSLRLQFQLASPITEFDPVIYGTQYSVPISSGRHLHHRHFAIGAADESPVRRRTTRSRPPWGRHQVKFGADVICRAHRRQQQGIRRPQLPGRVHLQHLHAAAGGVREPRVPGQHRQRARPTRRATATPVYTVNDTLWSLFVQDDFHARKDLTINLGLRYEQQTFTDSRKDFAPRVGFAYNLKRRRQDRNSRRLRHLLFADCGQLRGQLRAHRTHRRLQLHRRRRARSDSPPASPPCRCRRFRRARRRRCAACISARAMRPTTTSSSPPTR